MDHMAVISSSDQGDVKNKEESLTQKHMETGSFEHGFTMELNGKENGKTEIEFFSKHFDKTKTIFMSSMEKLSKQSKELKEDKSMMEALLRCKNEEIAKLKSQLDDVKTT